MTKTTKQQDLLKKQRKATKKSTSPLANALKDFKNSQNQETVKYTDEKGHKHTKKITLSDPGIDDHMRYSNLKQVTAGDADWVAIYQLVMSDVIANPKLSFKSEEAKLPTALKHKNVSAKNKNGMKVTLHFAWPGYSTATKILNETITPLGGLNMLTALHDLENNVFKDDNGRNVSSKYFNAGGKAFGLGYTAVFDAMDYLGAVMDHDGFNSIVNKGISFLQKAVPR